mgnify:CR=1 FL=1
MNPNVARCHLLARILAADGLMTDTERAALGAAMERHGLDDAQREAVRHFEGTDGASAALASLPEAERRQILDEVLAASLVDGRLSPLELQTVKEITQELGLGD